MSEAIALDGAQHHGVTNVVKAGLERAGAYVKDAVDKTREKTAGYREGGVEQVS